MKENSKEFLKKKPPGILFPTAPSAFKFYWTTGEFLLFRTAHQRAKQKT
jgi:hypothetical protein